MAEEEKVKTGAALAALRPTKKLTCAFCGRPFTGKGRAKYDSDRCRTADYRRRRLQERPTDQERAG